jgi:hypothetical protein
MYTGLGYNLCASRACVRPNGSCDCGILSNAGTTCNQNGTMQGSSDKYYDHCEQWIGLFNRTTYTQIITTRTRALPLGATCAASWECASQICGDGVCSGPQADGASCVGNFDCQSQNCQNGRCVPKGLCGVSCHSGAECAGGYCNGVAHTCGSEAGQYCTTDDNCASCHCSQGLCVGGPLQGINFWSTH